MPTWKCTAACKSCGTLSSPHVAAKLPRNTVVGAVREAAAAGFFLIVFTGGEPTLELDSVLDGIATASELHLATRLVTNAHWASDESSADEMLAKLVGVGLSEINYSTGDEHARFVPVENVLRAIRAAVRVGYAPSVMVETTKRRKITRQQLENHPYQIDTLMLYPRRIVNIHESPWMPLSPTRREQYPDGLAVSSENLATTQGCDSVLQTTTVQADGSLGACCGLGMRLIPELHIGRIGETPLNEAVADAEEDLLKRWIRVEGPEKILAWAASKDPMIEWEGMYAHRCQACLRLYKDPAVRNIIREYYHEKIADIIFAEYLLFHFDEKRDGQIAEQV